MKIVYNVLGFLFFSLGAIGAFLPILPTVPFLLISSVFFAKGSERFNKWFINTKLYKNNLEDFVERKEMTFKKKLMILIPVTIMLLLVFYFSNSNHARIAIIFALIFKYYYFIFKIKTINERFDYRKEFVQK